MLHYHNLMEAQTYINDRYMTILNKTFIFRYAIYYLHTSIQHTLTFKTSSL